MTTLKTTRAVACEKKEPQPKSEQPTHSMEDDMLFRQLIDFDTRTYTYLLADERRRQAILIDPVMGQVERDLNILNELGLQLKYVVETGIHGDHVSSGAMLRAETDAEIVVPKGAVVEGADIFIDHGEALFFGLLAIEARLIPGRTEGNAMYITSDLSFAFTGSSLLIRDLCRLDHPDSDPRKLWRSIQDNVLSLPDYTLLYPGRDHMGVTVTSVAEERRHNPYFKGSPTEQEFLYRLQARMLPPREEVDEVQAQNRVYHDKGQIQSGRPSEAWAPIERSVVGVPEVTVEWVFDSPGNYRLIDVRSLDEYRGPLGHIEGSELVPLGTLESQIVSWDRDERYVVVCRSGGRSGRAAMLMEEKGFNNVVSMAGGMNRWNALQYPTK
tara:strand:- start:632 stop:1783 length:1152 start_codon:yes stop_codon:yes gene_type:complete